MQILCGAVLLRKDSGVTNSDSDLPCLDREAWPKTLRAKSRVNLRWVQVARCVEVDLSPPIVVSKGN